MAKQTKLVEILGANNQAVMQSIDSHTLQLHLSSGEFSKSEPWFLKDEKNQEYVVLPQKVLRNIIMLIRKAHEDRLKVELERDIIMHAPIDFDDVMSVAINRVESLRGKDGSLPNIDSMQIVKEIKEKHPNLFIDLNTNAFVRSL
ncbi:DUF2603 domain-containing protein [Helicobacter sp. faydin-H20]|uniref:DUF2603 domain-containing protein n=1 Tax=Helicobacter anatolicus TaxID=2905874 RepID=UPI001E4847C1|nr:DUF2603 domain-containing protein [Helicobacter anatolicus]MCE3036263.1 DUF2603 domain-containing protein [Helicobacter anatolicus]MCE3038454.1 DUF2603 domain-containing protein [Helicobacter anatolicus]